jgi:tetratricopeptide (TPR) repeat protein
MYQNDTLNHILQLVEQRRLGRAINELENFLLSNPKLKNDMTRLIDLQSDFKLLTDYWQRGYDDPKRQEVYGQLLRRLYVLTTNIIIHQRLSASTFMMSVYQRPRQIRKDWSMSNLRNQLEGFVSDVALLQLEPAATRQERRRTIYREHQLLVHDLFDYIITSRSWNESLAHTFTDMLLLPTIDSNDQQLIVSAITLSAMNAFDIGKFNVLMNVYLQTSDMALRQRALVGWALCLGGASTAVYPEVSAIVDEACQDDTCLDELTELQMQLFYCMDAEEDQRKIHDEIIPDILNGSNIKVTRHGLVEMDEDTLDDILHPDKAEEGMEHMEQSMRRMVDMQKQGADIYFGGFSQMKRFPFYNDLSNWFVPFYHEHPAVTNIWDNTKGKRFLQTITKVGAFCDSDKYSFVLAFEQVLRQFPAKMLKMIEDGEASPQPLGGEIDIEEQQQPAFVRRMYLQNMYRFFRLFSMRSEFVNPFDSPQHYVFFAADAFKGSPLQQRMPQVAAFLMKRRRYEEAMSVLSGSASEASFDYNLLMGSLIMHLPMCTSMSATDYFRHALRQRPDNEQALSGYARAAFRYQNYEVALNAYKKLMDNHPDHRGYMLNSAICYVNMEKTDEALKLLFKLDYEQPDDMKTKRVLAWVLTVADRYEQASKHFQQLLAQPQPQAVDMLNYGYCLWFQGQVSEAIVYFKQFLVSQSDESFSLENEFKFTEYKLLGRHNIGNVEIELMLDALA